MTAQIIPFPNGSVQAPVPPWALGQAVAIAAAVHAHQTDKAGAPYILHVLAVMQMVAPDHEAMCVGVMHDVLEDCPAADFVAFCDSIRTKFGDRIFAACSTLTHAKGEPYDEYIERVAKNHLARTVKIADLTHNMDPRRIPAGQIVDKDFARWEKYRRALVRLERER